MITPHQLLFALLLGGSLLLLPGRDANLLAAAPDGMELHQVLGANASDLATLTNDAQALALFTSRLGPSLDLKEAVTILSSNSPVVDQKETGARSAPDLRTRAIEFMRHLAGWRLALAVLKAAESGPSSLEQLVREANTQHAWLVEKSDQPVLEEAWRLATALAEVPAPEGSEVTATDHYQHYADAVARAYPHFTSTEDSWLAIVEREGKQGVLNRLTAGLNSPSTQNQPTFAIRYFHERLRPVLTAHLVARAIRAEVAAEQQARAEWSQLRRLRENLREQRGLARLCGTWQWTVHNHQNHADHKIVMAFPPPDALPGQEPRPTKTVVLGDAVYLRWEFDRGIVQEDSLLFSNEGLRLEGTFVNSGGAWGGITAKRLTDCGGEKSRSAPRGSGDSASTPRPGRPSPR